jgi:Uma2 family endonuclease
MVQALTKPIRFDEFIDWYPEHPGCRYELRRGRIIEMPKPKGQHSRVAGNTIKQLNHAIDQAGLAYFIPRECIVKVADDTGYEPDAIVLDAVALTQEPRWESGSILENGASIKLVVEVVSTNWRDDYVVKMSDYEAMGISEYWVLDYLGLGGRRFIGTPKQPTVTVCSWVDGEYEMRLFRGADRIISPTFPDLVLTAAQVLMLDDVPPAL